MYWILVGAALAPVVLLFIYILAKDLRQPEPLRWLLKALFFGVLAGILVISVLTPLGQIKITGWATAFANAFLMAAIPEESAKLLMLWLLLRKNPYYDERLDGIVYAACIGLGFAGLENIGYIVQSYMSGGAWLSTAASRALFAVPGHFFFGVIMGFFYALATFSGKRYRPLNLFLAWSLPVLAHGLYDGILMGMGTVDEYVAGILLIVFLLAFNRLRKYSVSLIDIHQSKLPVWLLLVGLASYSAPAFAWGQEGHRIIARIAYDNLSCRTRKQMDKVLGDHGMIYWSNWPDEIKSDTIYPQSIKDGWHFQDLNGGMTDSAVVAALSAYPAEGGSLFRATDSIISVLKEKNGDADTWRFLVHLAGDRYCPMHLAHMDDKGGNTVKMRWFGRETNLHAVWDTKLIESQGYSYTEYARKLEREYAYEKKSILRMSEEELILRNYHFTESIYAYHSSWDGNAYHYIYRWRAPMEEQLYIAGIRLAKWLNEICKH